MIIDEQESAVTRTPLLEVGQPAPTLRLPDLDGAPMSLDGLRGQIVLVSFLRHAG